MSDGVVVESPCPGLQELLEEMYFDCEGKEDLTREDIAKLGQIIRKLLWLEPSTRASARSLV